MRATAGAYWLCWALQERDHRRQASRRGGADFSAAQRYVRAHAGRRVIERYQVKWQLVSKCRKRYKQARIHLSGQQAPGARPGRPGHACWSAAARPRRCGSSGPRRAGTRRPRCRPARRSGRRPAPRPSRSWRSPAARRRWPAGCRTGSGSPASRRPGANPRGSGAVGCSSRSSTGGEAALLQLVAHLRVTAHDHARGHLRGRSTPPPGGGQPPPPAARSIAGTGRLGGDAVGSGPRWVKASVTPAPRAMATSALSTSTRRRRRPAGDRWCLSSHRRTVVLATAGHDGSA